MVFIDFMILCRLLANVCISLHCLFFSQAEQLFQRLNLAKSKFVDWVVLGSMDVDSLVEQYCIKVPDWERSFRALKAKGREAEKLPK